MEYTYINEKGQVEFDLNENLIQIPTGLRRLFSEPQFISFFGIIVHDYI